LIDQWLYNEYVLIPQPERPMVGSNDWFRWLEDFQQRHPSEVARLNQMLRDPNIFVLVPGEAWSDAVNHEFAAMSPAARADWLELFVHAGSATGSRPSAMWSSKAKALVRKAGAKKFAEALVRWFPLVNVPRTIRRLGAGMEEG